MDFDFKRNNIRRKLNKYDIEVLEYAQTIRMSLENEFNYNGICSHEGSETIESDHRSSRD